MTETWLGIAIKRPGPAEKQGYSSYTTRNLADIQGEVKHSAEGHLTAVLEVLSQPGNNKSWTFTVSKAGTVYQHYPLEAITWHAGYLANPAYIGEEHEGVAGEPLTDAQYQATLLLSLELRKVLALGPPSRETNLREHNEFMATACPSGRITWERLMADIADREAVTVDPVLLRLDAVLWAVQDLQVGLQHIFKVSLMGWEEYERGEYERPPWPPVWPE